MFRFRAEGNALSILSADRLASGSVGSYQARFEFGKDWEDLSKIAVFRAGDEARSVPLDDTGLCVIPWEVLANCGQRLYTGVCGMQEGVTAQATVWAYCGKIYEGAVPGDPSWPPTPNLWEQELAHKQDKLSGLPGQIVGFNAKGNAMAQDVLSDGGGTGPGQAVLRYVIRERRRDSGKPAYGLEDLADGAVLETGNLSGEAAISVLANGREYAAKNMSASGGDVPDGTIIIRKMEA